VYQLRGGLIGKARAGSIKIARTLHVKQLVQPPALSEGKISSSLDTPTSNVAPPVNFLPVFEFRVASRMDPNRSMICGMEMNIQKSEAASGPTKHFSSAARAEKQWC